MAFDVSKIGCVVVLYRPSWSVFCFVASLSNFGYQVILVNNSCGEEILEDLSTLSNVSVLGDGSNVGLATAINAGLRFAFETIDCRFTILFDQDSSPKPEMPRDLAIELSNAANEQIASISPRLVDQKAPLAVCPTATMFNRAHPGSVPSSGTLIAKHAWLTIGPMLDKLFIDGIDHEWCFRACSRDFDVMVSPTQTMIHNMGDSGFGFFGVYKPIHRTPFRHYFIVRNAIFLSKLSYIPLQWRLIELLKTVRRIFVYSIVSTNRSQSIKLMAKALHDGICGKMGPLKGTVR